MIPTALLVFLSVFIVAQDGCDSVDLDQDGWTVDEGDCDDQNPEVNPGAVETCNGMDDNCDGQIDEGFPTVTGYLDSDGDGYGLETGTVEACTQPEGYAPARGDCADDVPTTYPGAEDVAGDGIDADCGGTDDADPHVGLTETSYTTIQAALDAAADGQVVWVGPGTYLEHELTMSGKAIALRSTRGEDLTVVDGQGAGTVVLFVGGEGADSVLDGFTVREGVASYNCKSGGHCGYDGGGMFIDSSSPSLTQVTLSGNTASEDGGGMFLYDSSPSLTDVTLSGNTASEVGGGMSLDDSSPSLAQVTLSGNTASNGGGMYLRGSSPSLTQVTLSGNTASDKGGGMFLRYDSSPILTDTILAHNNGANLWSDESTPILFYCNLYNPYGTSHNLDSLDPTNLEVDPEFVSFSNDGDPSNDDLHLRPNSPLIDAGDPDLDNDSISWETDLDDQDPDGTRIDIGVFGGTDADWSGYEDSDSDGLYDAWETSHGLDPTRDDSQEDLDGDGASNLEEFETGTDPQGADSDGDGYTDGAELEAGTDGLNRCAQPGVEGLVALQVPGEYATIQEAVDAVQTSCRIEVAPGGYAELIRIEGKGIELVGLEGAEGTILDGEGQGSVVTVIQADLSLEGFTVTGGAADEGGGVYLRFMEGKLDSVIVKDNTASDYGGGMYLFGSSPSLTQITLSGNTASDDGGGCTCLAHLRA